MVVFTLKTGLFGLISEGQMMVGVRITKSEKTKCFKTFRPGNFRIKNQIQWAKYFKPEKNCPVSANVKKTVSIM
jgi:hypothetical protein